MDLYRAIERDRNIVILYLISNMLWRIFLPVQSIMSYSIGVIGYTDTSVFTSFLGHQEMDSSGIVLYIWVVLRSPIHGSEGFRMRESEPSLRSHLNSGQHSLIS